MCIINTYVYICIYSYMNMYIYIYIERERETQHMVVSTLFVTAATTDTLDGTILCVRAVSSPPCPICSKVRGQNTSYTQHRTN